MEPIDWYAVGEAIGKIIIVLAITIVIPGGVFLFFYTYKILDMDLYSEKKKRTINRIAYSLYFGIIISLFILGIYTNNHQ